MIHSKNFIVRPPILQNLKVPTDILNFFTSLLDYIVLDVLTKLHKNSSSVK